MIRVPQRCEQSCLRKMTGFTFVVDQTCRCLMLLHVYSWLTTCEVGQQADGTKSHMMHASPDKETKTSKTKSKAPLLQQQLLVSGKA